MLLWQPPQAPPQAPPGTPPKTETPPVVAKAPEAAVLALSVDPATAKVLVNGKPAATPGGQGRVEGLARVGDEVEITATAPGRKAFRQTVKVAQATQTVTVHLEKAAAPDKPAPATPADTGYVTINARPWADVYWKGRKVGTTPLRSFEVPVGNQVFVLKNQVASRNLNVTVEKGRTTSHVVDVK